MAAGKVALMPKDELSWLTSDQVDEDYLIENMSKMEGKLAVQKKMNNVKDIRETIDNLIEVANLLEVADKASEKFHVNVQIKDMTVKYQKLIGEIRVELKVFRMKSHYALTKHADAAMLIMDEDSTPEEVYEMLPDAIEEFSSCIDIAKELCKTAQDLTNKARSLEDDSHKALAAATEQDVRNEELKRDLEKMMQEAVARKKKQEVLAREYKAEVEEYSRKERDAIEQAKSDADRAFSLQMAGLITSAVGGLVKSLNPMSVLQDLKAQGQDQESKGGSGAGVLAQVSAVEKEMEDKEAKKVELEKEAKKLDKEIKEAEKTQQPKETIEELQAKKKAKEEAIEAVNQAIKGVEARIDKMAEAASNSAADSAANARRLGDVRNKKRQLQIENAAALAETAEVLSNIKIEVGDVRTAIAMIKVVINCLGRIATALEATATFWHEQAEKCSILQKMGENLKNNMTKYAEKHHRPLKKKVIHSLKDSGYTWMSLWHMNYHAMQEIEEPYQRAKSVVNNFGIKMTPEQLQSKAKAVGANLQIEAKADLGKRNC